MATEISNGIQTVKLYHSVNRGKAIYQLAYYAGGRRVQKNLADKSEAKRVAKQFLGELSNDAEAVEFFLRHHRADAPRLSVWQNLPVPQSLSYLPLNDHSLYRLLRIVQDFSATR
jgi:hypothetical protein